MSVVFTVLYPRSGEARFDFDYYTGKHIPLVREVMAPAGVRLTKGVGAPGGGEAPYVLIAELEFESQESLQKALAHDRAQEVFADVEKFTDIRPVVQVGASLAA